MQVCKRHALCNAVGGISFMFNDILVDFSELPKATDCGVVLLVSVHTKIAIMCAQNG